MYIKFNKQANHGRQTAFADRVSTSTKGMSKLCFATLLGLVALLMSPTRMLASPSDKSPKGDRPPILLPPSLKDKKFKAKPAPTDDLDSLIVGGVVAQPDRYPFMVNLNSGFGDNYCGGSLIASNVVLSAAHCAGARQVTIGRFDLWGDSSGSYETITVAEEVTHSGYDGDTMENDIMLIRLARESEKPTVSINWDGSANVDQMLTVMGWGTTSEGGSQPDKLRYVELPYITNSKCNNDYRGGITNDMMCAGYQQGGKDSCQGDSGGPLIISGGSSAGQDVQVGVVSWGIGCAQPGYPGVYSRISESWNDFLQSQLQSWGVDLNPSPGPGPGPGPGPSPPPTDCYVCNDDPDYLFKGKRGRSCSWVAKRTRTRCRQGVNVVNCPEACGVC